MSSSAARSDPKAGNEPAAPPTVWPSPSHVHRPNGTWASAVNSSMPTWSGWVLAMASSMRAAESGSSMYSSTPAIR